MKTTNYQKLENLYNEKQSVSGLRKSNLRNSVYELLYNGKTRTGASAWISLRRGASKEVWTEEIHTILNNFGIAHVCGNDAPRGGANGEYVQITSKAFMAVVKKMSAERAARLAEEKRIAADKAALAEEQRKAQHKRMNELVEANIDNLMSVDLLSTLSEWTKKYFTSANNLTKNETKEIARKIVSTTGLDYQICIWFVRGPRFASYIESKLK